jgi:photosystem II stability/assembly factor-like uncharacterized protein
LTRYRADGALDHSFGTGGKLTTDFGNAANPNEAANALAVQADGKLVAAGSAGAGFYQGLALARYRA